MISKSGFVIFQAMGSIKIIEMESGVVLLSKRNASVIVQSRINVATIKFDADEWMLAIDFLSWLKARAQTPGRARAIFQFLSTVGGETYFRNCLKLNPLDYEDFRQIFYRYLGEYESEADRKLHEKQERNRLYGW